MAERGLFITFEGPEGAGKSTQAQLLRDHIERRSPGSAVLTREPGGTVLAERLRTIIKHYDGEEALDDRAEVLLIEAGRAQHVAQVILPALEAGKTVICDRFSDSTLAYQGAGRGQELTDLAMLNRYAAHGLTPDLTFLLDLPSEAGLERTRLRGGSGAVDRLEKLEIEFHRRLRRAYLALAEGEPSRFRVVDATQPMETVTAAIAGEFDHVAVR